MVSAVPDQYQRPELLATPQLNQEINRNFYLTSMGTHNKRNVLRDTVYEDSIVLPGRNLNNWQLSYIDDLNIGEVHALEKAKLHITTSKEKKTIRATHCEKRFSQITSKAEEVGMVINGQKTQLLCVSDNRNSDVSSYINVGENLSLIHI